MISLDFCYTKAGVVDRNPRALDRGEMEHEEVIDLFGEGEQQDLREGEEPPLCEVKAAMWLMLVCSQTGPLGAVPLKGNDQIHLMAREVVTFIQGLGHTEAGIYNDNEPTLRSLLQIILESRHAMGLRTKMYTTKVKDSPYQIMQSSK